AKEIHFCILHFAFCILHSNPAFPRPARYNSIPRVMASALIEYLSARADAATFILPSDYPKTIEELFPHGENLLPEPYKIFLEDETQPAVLGFPLAETAVIKELDTKLDRWLTAEVAWQVTR